MLLNGVIGELPRFDNASVALKSSGETYKYLPVFELIRLSKRVNGMIYSDPSLLLYPRIYLYTIQPRVLKNKIVEIRTLPYNH